MGAHRDPDFQRRSTESGKTFRDQCNTHLRSLGFTLLGRKIIADAGIEIDQVAVNTKGKKIYFEFKSGYEGTQPGLIRTDTTKKMLCNAFLMRECGLNPFVVIASVKATEGLSSDKMIRRAAAVVFDIISLSHPGDRKRLKELLDMDDFSESRLKGTVQKVGVAKTRERVPLPVASDDAFQIAWHPDLKVHESGKRQKRKVSGKRSRKLAEDQPKLFDNE
ncbi:MAG: hypothetical protein ACLP5H_12480 [Desulfomonilaceae bacterium]